MTVRAAAQLLRTNLSDIYSSREAVNIGNLVISHLTGKSRSELLIDQQLEFSAEEENLFKKYLDELLRHRPMQYVLQEAWFAGMKFFVDERVLIPRPETEELVEWIVTEAGPTGRRKRILDIGTGSGCIAVAVKAKIPDAEVIAIDISADAIEVAKMNAENNGVSINFRQLDITDRNSWPTVPASDIVVSNPPYILFDEQKKMDPHVVEYEPSLALFVPDHDPLFFYRLIAELFRQQEQKSAQLFFECHEDYALDVYHLLGEMEFRLVELRNDLQQKPRMVRARLQE